MGAAISIALYVLALTWAHVAPAAAPEISIAPGSGSFVFVDGKGDPAKRITVYTYLPAGLAPRTAPIVFTLHGVSKDAAGSRDTWIEHAEKYRFMVIAPLFDREQWGAGGYSYASVVGRDGTIHDESRWSFSAIEHLFDAIKSATGNESARYYLYGHSEGGQFVQRLVLFLPDARYARAVAANPGWYTMPTFESRFPYGLGGSPAAESGLGKSLGRDFVLMLGDRDSDPNHFQLRRTLQAMAQGANRFERGQNYFKTAENRAAELRADFRWRLRVVPDAAHDNARMSGPAAAILMERTK